MKSPTRAIPAHVSRHLNDHAHSGLSVRAYCAKHSISYWTFRYWSKRWERHAASPMGALPLKEVGMISLTRSVCDVHFPSGIRISVNAGARSEDLASVFALLTDAQAPC